MSGQKDQHDFKSYHEQRTAQVQIQITFLKLPGLITLTIDYEGSWLKVKDSTKLMKNKLHVESRVRRARGGPHR